MPSNEDTAPKTDTLGVGGFGALMRVPDCIKIAGIYGGLAYIDGLPDSPAHRAGMRRGDIVLTVNGHPTPNLDAYVAARALRDDGATVCFLRNGVERQVELSWS